MRDIESVERLKCKFMGHNWVKEKELYPRVARAPGVNTFRRCARCGAEKNRLVNTGTE